MSNFNIYHFRDAGDRVSMFFGFCPLATGKMPVPQNVDFLAFFSAATGKMPVPQNVDFLAFFLAETGKMPVPQRVDFIVRRASCPLIT